MSQWSQVIPCTLDKAENYWRYRDDGVVWKGPADLSAQLRFGWDDAAFYLAADVSDDIHVNNQDPANIWNGDSLEFALQPVDEFDHNPITKVILALARGTSCIMGVQTKHAGPLPLAGATVLVTRGTGHTFYQARLPWSELFPGRLAPTAGSHLRTAAMLNEDDGTGRNAYMCWFGRLTYPTLGETMFTDMTLLNG